MDTRMSHLESVVYSQAVEVPVIQTNYEDDTACPGGFVCHHHEATSQSSKLKYGHGHKESNEDGVFFFDHPFDSSNHRPAIRQ
jgi:hypothetical protein